MIVKEITLKPNEEYITLGILLKMVNLISTGGMAKIFLFENLVEVNGEIENRRGRKLYSGDKVLINDITYLIK